MKFVTGQDYTSPSKRKILVDMAKQWVEHSKHHKNKLPYCDRYLDHLINLDILKQGYGYTQGIEDDDGYLHCLLVGELVENYWVQQCDGNVICLLTNRPYNPEYPKMLVDRFAEWCKARDCTNLYMFSWSPRKAYEKLFTNLDLEKSGYTYARKLK
tara:strand:- start:65 stop:532 length:468 start_codon:yes stop_codon:yes gene_type:complete